MTGRAFDKCRVLGMLSARTATAANLLRAFNSATYLEDLTGLTQMRDAEAALGAMALSTTTSDDDGDE